MSVPRPAHVATPRARSFVPYLLSVVGLSLVACAVPAPRVTAAAFSEAGLADAFRTARELVAQDIGEPLDEVTLLLASDARIAREVRRETERLAHRQFDDPRYAADFVDRVMRGQAGTYAALYASPTRTVMVSRPVFEDYGRSLGGDEPTRRAAVLALMIHELVHAADDRRHHIESGRSLDFRASFAESATYEGHAQWVTRRLCARAGCLPGLEALDAFMFGEAPGAGDATPSSATLGRNVLEYSYVEGERFLASIAARERGDELVRALLDAPPADPVQVLDPASWPNVARETRNERLHAAASGFPHPWHEGAWTSVATSPLKGVDLRDDPERRRAAIDGFTRLVVAMTALELHDQGRPGARPVEVTLLESESPEVARLFARSLHDNAAQAGTASPEAPRRVRPSGRGVGLRRSSLALSGDEGVWRTLVADEGPWVVRIVAFDQPAGRLDDYALGVLDALAGTGPALSTSDRSR